MNFSQAQFNYDNAMPPEGVECTVCGHLLNDEDECETCKNAEDKIVFLGHLNTIKSLFEEMYLSNTPMADKLDEIIEEELEGDDACNIWDNVIERVKKEID